MACILKALYHKSKDYMCKDLVVWLPAVGQGQRPRMSKKDDPQEVRGRRREEAAIPHDNRKHIVKSFLYILR